MLIAVAAALFVALATVLAVVLRGARLRRIAADMTETHDFGGTQATLPEAIWALSSLGATAEVQTCFEHSSARDVAVLVDDVRTTIDALPAERVAEIAEQLRSRRAIGKSVGLWNAHSRFVNASVGLGGVDSALFVAGDNADWIQSTVDHDSLSDGVAGALASLLTNPPRLHLPVDEIAPQLTDHLEQLLAPVADAAVDASAEALGAALAVFDAHIPVATTIAALNRARRSHGAGLDGGRVGENLAWDLGARGGGIAAGATLGTAIFPVVGTVIGGVLGGLFGGEVAQEGKGRHLRGAEREAERSLHALGASISASTWNGLARPAREEVNRESSELGMLDSTPRRGSWWPSVHDEVLLIAVEIGHREHAAFNADVAAFAAEVWSTSSNGQESARAVMVMTRPQMRRSLDVDNALVRSVRQAHQAVDVERRNLTL